MPEELTQERNKEKFLDLSGWMMLAAIVGILLLLVLKSVGLIWPEPEGRPPDPATLQLGHPSVGGLPLFLDIEPDAGTKPAAAQSHEL